MNRFTIHDTPMAGLKVIQRQQLGDTRGFLARLFCAEELKEAGWRRNIAQINFTYTAKIGVVRGMHFQNPPSAEMKLVTCLHGRVWDVAVDVRAGSETFLQYYAVELSCDNLQALLIPEGFAHGFQALSQDCELLYLHSHAYTPASEAGLNPTDPRLQIDWPLPISDLSAKDQQRAFLTNAFTGITP